MNLRQVAARLVEWLVGAPREGWPQGGRRQAPRAGVAGPKGWQVARGMTVLPPLGQADRDADMADFSDDWRATRAAALVDAPGGYSDAKLWALHREVSKMLASFKSGEIADGRYLVEAPPIQGSAQPAPLGQEELLVKMTDEAPGARHERVRPTLVPSGGRRQHG